MIGILIGVLGWLFCAYLVLSTAISYPTNRLPDYKKPPKPPKKANPNLPHWHDKPDTPK